MTTVREIIDEAVRRGVVLAVEGDRLSWRAPAGAMTPELIESIKGHKAAILAELREPDVIARQRYGRPPDCEIPLAVLKPVLSDRDVELVADFITRQPPAVVRWVCVQADRYDVAASKWQPPAVRELAAMLDVILWQWEQVLTPPQKASRYDRVQESIRRLRDLHATSRSFDKLRSKPVDKKAMGEPNA